MLAQTLWSKSLKVEVSMSYELDPMKRKYVSVGWLVYDPQKPPVFYWGAGEGKLMFKVEIDLGDSRFCGLMDSPSPAVAPFDEFEKIKKSEFL